jgi:hypothetical protein
MPRPRPRLSLRQRARLHENLARHPRNRSAEKFGIKKLGAKLNFYKALPEMFEQFRNGLLSAEHQAHGVIVEHYIIFSGLKVLLDGSQIATVHTRDFRLRV